MNMFKQASSCALAAAFVSSLAACGGGESDGTGGTDGSGGSGTGGTAEVDSGLPEDTPASELSDSQIDQLCETYDEAIADSIAAIDLCTSTAYTGTAIYYYYDDGTIDEAAAQEFCTLNEQYCDDNPELVEEPMPEPCLASGEPSGTCEATVGQFEDCLDGRLAAVRTLYNPAETCETLTLEGLTEYLEGVEAIMEPVACEEVTAACPDGL